MYHKADFEPRELAQVHRVIRENPFAALVSHSEQGLMASNLAFTFDAERGPHGTLLSHMAAPNPQAELLRSGQPMMVLFQGIHGYVSPRWYPQRDTAPTWDYEVVHCHGVPRVHQEQSPAVRNLQRLVEKLEDGADQAWKLRDLGAGGLTRRLPLIVCFEIEIQHVEAKLKMHQDERPTDTVAAIQKLRESRDSELADRIVEANPDLETQN